ncbi:hypothetical protein BDV96DRAFT_566116 [Lophiotrema nucula]|uniref:Uncharacterized protein n=1 Tax=Lophiotrema nucula TaxID=690887 RepID=A0A6A5ZPU6_9PLEO|nr:hypothetical protein BDV96DRAFT_566116 [Lophiotrema nucula]
MVEPFTALGAAGNIIQFVDFSCKLIRNACSIAKSATGASEATVQLTGIAKDVERLSGAIHDSEPYPEHLKHLAAQCKSIAGELLEALARLRREGSHSTWKSFRVALKEIWKQKEIDHFVQRLTMLQNQLVLNMQELLTNHQSELVREITGLRDESRRMNLTLRDSIDELRKVAQSELDKLHWKSSESRYDRSPITSLDDSSGVSGFSLEGLCRAFNDLDIERADLKNKQQILRSLYFPRFALRHERIEEAHRRTFQWAFENHLQDSDQPVHFNDWLESGDRVFWVRGKAGAGKSTLMKYVCQHPQTSRLLRAWAGRHQLVTAKYFFWNAGTTLQKSQEGLIRTLLFDMLNASNELIPIFQQKLSDLKAWHGYETPEDQWSDAKGMISICSEVLKSSPDKRFCFFIDGLDEYKGDSDALIQLIHDLIEISNVKICVSSRPWAQFVDAFGQDEEHLLKLEVLTRADIVNYTTDRLSQNAKFSRLKNIDQGYEDIATEVVDKARGVFLWVHLVVKSLLEGARYADSVEDMRLRLDSFPPDLEDFFRHILQDIPPIYRRKTAQMFSLANTAEVPMPLMIYSFMDDLDRDARFAIDKRKEPMSSLDIGRRNDQVPPRLDGRSKGLLEVVLAATDRSFFKFEVDFLHRTVRDFLRTSDIQDMFDQALVKSWNPHIVLYNAYLAMLKLAPFRNREQIEQIDDHLLDAVEGLFHFASQVRLSSHNPDELIHTLDQAKDVLASPDYFVDFVAMAIHAGLDDFVDHTLGVYGYLYLDDALQLPWKKKRFNGDWQLSPKIVSLLIKLGESLDHRSAGHTLWTSFLSVVEARPELQTEDTFEICKILVLEGGADISAAMPSSYMPDSKSPVRSTQSFFSGRFLEKAERSSPPRNAEPAVWPAIWESALTQNASATNPSRRTALDVLRRIVPKTVIDVILANKLGRERTWKRAFEDLFHSGSETSSHTEPSPKKKFRYDSQDSV